MFSAFAARFVLATRALCLGAMAVFAGAHVVVAEESPGFHLCNKTPDVINVALGRYKDGTFVSNGWWVISPEQCADLINRALSARFLYVLATDPFGQVILDGATPICVKPEYFEIRGDSECLTRGYLQGNSREIDTGTADGFTLSVYPDGAVPDEM